MEQIFDFATYARHWFEHGTVEQQRSILLALGSNIFLHDKKVWVDQLKPFMALKELKNSEEYKKITFELKEKSLESVKKDNHLSDYPTLRSTWVWNQCVVITAPFKNHASRVILAKSGQVVHYKK